jgi:hypothetical protein
MMSTSDFPFPKAGNKPRRREGMWEKLGKEKLGKEKTTSGFIHPEEREKQLANSIQARSDSMHSKTLEAGQNFDWAFLKFPSKHVLQHRCAAHYP